VLLLQLSAADQKAEKEKLVRELPGVAHSHQLKDWWVLEKAGIPQKE